MRLRLWKMPRLAIEQGVNLGRQTGHGLSAAFDYEDRVLGAMDHFHASDYAMVADLRAKGVRTIYSRCGDWFGRMSMAAFPLLIIRAFRPMTRTIVLL
jgi:apolipoprotein N-acyltransferase